MNENKSYRNLLKVFSVFGGVQVFTIIIGIIRVKLISILIGPSGVGLYGYLTNLITLIFSIFGLGIPNSSIKFISEKEHAVKREIIILNVRTMLLVLGTIGLIFTVIFSREISYLIFENNKDSNILSVSIIGIAVLFYGLEQGELAILQSQREVKKIAKARIISSLIALIGTIPLYFIYGIDGISFALVLTYILNCIVVFYFSKNKFIINKIVNRNDFLLDSKKIITLGFSMALSTFLLMAASFIIKSIINSNGSMVELGYYEAGYTIVNGYVGLIFIAMAKDYFPSLSSINLDNIKIQKLCNQQIEIALLIILPVLIVLIATVEFVLRTLYTADFIQVKYFIYGAVLGVVFKLVSWSFSYIVLAKGNWKMFLGYEVIGFFILLFTQYFGYKYFGLFGLGLAYLVYHVTYFILLLALNNYKYKISLENSVIKILGVTIIITSLTIFCNAFVIEKTALHSLNAFVFIFGLTYSIYLLNKKMKFIELFLNFFNK